MKRTAAYWLSLILAPSLISCSNDDSEKEITANTTIWFADLDGDTFGDAENTQEAEQQPLGYVENNLDCNDTNIAINPGVVDIYDGEDNNCDGQVDENGDPRILIDNYASSNASNSSLEGTWIGIAIGNMHVQETGHQSAGYRYEEYDIKYTRRFSMNIKDANGNAEMHFCNGQVLALTGGEKISDGVQYSIDTATISPDRIDVVALATEQEVSPSFGATAHIRSEEKWQLIKVNDSTDTTMGALRFDYQTQYNGLATAPFGGNPDEIENEAVALAEKDNDLAVICFSETLSSTGFPESAPITEEPPTLYNINSFSAGFVFNQNKYILSSKALKSTLNPPLRDFNFTGGSSYESQYESLNSSLSGFSGSYSIQGEQVYFFGGLSRFINSSVEGEIDVIIPIQ